MRSITLFIYFILIPFLLKAQKSEALLPEHITYGMVDWSGSNEIFSMRNAPHWDFSMLTPYVYVNQPIDQVNQRLSINKGLYSKDFYTIQKDQLKLKGIDQESNFTDQAFLHFKMQSGNYILRKNKNKRQRSSYTLSSTIARNQISHSFNSLPKNTDSIRISVEYDVRKNINSNGTIKLYDGTHNTTLIITTTRTNLKIDIKYAQSELWYAYDYRVSDLPPMLVSWASKVPKTEYAFFEKNQLFPLFSYEFKGKGAKNIRIRSRHIIESIPIIGHNQPHLEMTKLENSTMRKIILTHFKNADYRLNIYDYLGKRIAFVNLRNNNSNIYLAPIKEIPKGIYYCNLMDDNGIRSSSYLLVEK